jgi:ATP-dependent protease ClpP protease subunit
MADTIFISFYGDINSTTAKVVMDSCSNVVAEASPQRLYFLFSSGGGSVDAGMALYGFLRSLPVPLVMHNVGSVDSVANVVFLAADERYASPHAMFLLHGITWGFGQGARLTWTQLQETVSRFRADEDRLSSVIISRTSITKDELTALFHQGQTKDLAFAKDKGLIREIAEPKVPAGSRLITLSFA